MSATPPASGRSTARLAACAGLACLLACGGERPARPGAGAAPAGGKGATATGGAPAATSGPVTAPGQPATYTAGPVDAGGAVSGRVTYRGTPPPPAPVMVTKDKEVCGRMPHRSEDLVVGADGGLRNAVVSIDPVPRGKPWPAGGKPTLDQRGCWFLPHVLLAPAGVEIDILNSDGILHNIHTHPKVNPPINLAQPKYKKVLTHAFERPDLVRVVCDVHSWMKAWIVVAAHPYHAVTGPDGSFALDQVPPVSYTLRAWHETLGTREQAITVAPGGRIEADLSYGG